MNPENKSESLAPAPRKSLTYSSYLKVDELLALQVPKSEPAEHDEMLFIIIHQVYELWFKQLLHEFDKVCRDLTANRLYGVMASIKRCRTIMKVMVAQLDILETMTPMEFNSFRNRLESASGFQSAQFRELEFLLGYKRANMIQFHPTGTPGRDVLLKRISEPSIMDHFYDFLAARGYEIPAELRSREATAPTVANEQIQEHVLDIYRNHPDAAQLLESMVDFDEGLQEWRYRHVKMVERTIGMKPGTGGSSGAEFLRRTLFQPAFPDLWAIRHRL
ncbi:MAG: tryptophan 2,3-dioxygenase [Phycisphaerae bacterium]